MQCPDISDRRGGDAVGSPTVVIGVRVAIAYVICYGENVLSAQMLEVSLLGVGTVLRFERDAWVMVK